MKTESNENVGNNLNQNNMVFTLEELNNWPTAMQDGKWYIAKPHVWVGMKFSRRLKAAWLVLRNKAICTRWL